MAQISKLEETSSYEGINIINYNTLLPANLSVLIDAAISETEGLKEEFSDISNENLKCVEKSDDNNINNNNNNNNNNTNNSNLFATSTSTVNNTHVPINSNFNSSTDTIDFSTIKTEISSHSNGIIDAPNSTIPSPTISTSGLTIDENKPNINHSNGTHSSSIKDIEISKLPLRKRHLVPDNFYYNVYQNVCVSPQSPTNKPLNVSNFGLNSKSSFYQFERHQQNSTKSEMIIDMEQRVPSPKSLSESTELLNSKNNSSKQSKHSIPVKNEEDVDIMGGVDDDTTSNLLNKKVKVKKEHHHHNNYHKQESSKKKPQQHHHQALKKYIDDDDDFDDKMDIEIESPPKIKTSHSSVSVTPLDLSKSNSSDDIDIDILDDDDITTTTTTTTTIPKKHHHHHHHNNHKHKEEKEENLTIHHSRENIKIEQHQKDNNNKKRPLHSISNHKPKKSKENLVKKFKTGHNNNNHHHKKEKLSDKETDSDDTSSSGNSSSSSESDSDVEERGDRLYCLCQKKYDPNQFMIACDKCDEWYHGECVNISEKDAKKIKSYLCIKCKRKEKVNQLHINTSNLNNSSLSNNNLLHSPKISPAEKKRALLSHQSSPILQSPISPTLSESSKLSPTYRSGDNITTSATTPLSLSSPSSPPVPNDSNRCKGPKCTGIAMVNSKYCSKECANNSASEFVSKNNIQKQLLNSISSGSGSSLTSSASSITTPVVPVPSADTQKLLSTSNEDIDKLKSIATKRHEVEGKLKILEKKTSDFEKLINQTKLKIESNPSLYINQHNINNNSNNNQVDNNVKIETMYNNNSITTATPISTLNSPISPSLYLNICIYPMKESTTGFCGIVQCSQHNGWEKKRKDLFAREHNFHTKTLRDLSLEEKQIHQRIARRNKITQSTPTFSSTTPNLNLTGNDTLEC
ncbi:PHD zinc finger-containing protein [Tieghemostelium lacteum]|uniref:PHD zinc finger-containing protein n=1 Tax=Tieghemostelium lacteum TaxID=361077 RepID=A0A151Z3L2_TIELA|nr:PHD zinc finger-containing protein [Tieghemostelium lacteum]|eukprot:KYQ88552.1 PHD zinc finger-containing protein [Tieghemostelium lacteum]